MKQKQDTAVGKEGYVTFRKKQLQLGTIAAETLHHGATLPFFSENLRT